jgi:uncharacterized repeat protein (TIGR03803 family)
MLIREIKIILSAFTIFISINTSSAQRLFAMTTQGGHFSGACNYDVPQCGIGMILEYNCATDSISPEFYFTDSTGYIPDGYMILANDGNLYGLNTIGGLNALSPNGVIPSGGANAGGTLFQYNYQTGSFTVEENFDALAGPGGALVQAGDGNLYGLTSQDGDNGGGTIFQYNYNTQTFTVVQNLPDSSWPGDCTLMQAGDGNLYGMTTSNGANFSGTLFQYDYKNNIYTKKKDMPYGAWPFGSALVEASDSNLYGRTASDGYYNNGTIFQYNYRKDTFIVMKNFPTAARNPYSDNELMQASDGNLYGLTYGDGTHRGGTLFQYNYTTNTYKVMVNLPTNAWPWGGLMQASDGNLYGFTQKDGAYGDGTLFQYNPVTDSFTVKVNFDGTNGAFPVHSKPVEVPDKPSGIKKLSSSSGNISIYPNPADGHFTLNIPKEETAIVEIYNMLGAKVYSTTGRQIPASSKIDISAQAAGVYLLTVQDDTGVHCTRIVKE